MKNNVYVYNIQWGFSVGDVIKDMDQEKAQLWFGRHTYAGFNDSGIAEVEKDPRLMKNFQTTFLPNLPEEMELRNIDPYDKNTIAEIVCLAEEMFSSKYGFTITNYSLAGVFTGILSQKVSISFISEREYPSSIADRVVQTFIEACEQNCGKDKLNISLIDGSVDLSTYPTEQGIQFTVEADLKMSNATITTLHKNYPQDKVLAGAISDTNVDRGAVCQALARVVDNYVEGTMEYRAYIPKVLRILSEEETYAVHF